QTAQGGRHSRTDTMSPHLGRNRGMIHFATSGASTEMPLKLGDFGGQRRQLGDLMPGRLRIVWAGLLGPPRLALGALFGNQTDDLVDPFGRKALLQMRGMAWLAARLAAGRLFVGSGRQLGWRTWRRGRLELVHQVAQLAFQFEDLGLQLGNA